MSSIGLPKLRSGKVRDVYEIGHDRLLMVASDRISAFDVVLDEPIPDKGRVLTGLSTFWFDKTSDIVPNHLISADPTDFPETAGPSVAGRAMMVKAARPVLMECVVRGYLFGSAWSEYQKQGTVNGEPLPPGLALAEELPEPIFTPTTKADEGHDMALTREDAIALVGQARYEELSELSIAIYRYGTTVASTRGILLADTKLEFGTVDGQLILIDEILTPDSSRFWPADEYEPGTSPPSYDKQFVRQYLLDQGWDGTPPPPALPETVVEGTRSRYVEAYETLTEKSFDDWYGVGD
ncbi:MAG TPA: phosphoribosylaminoimidazolesuccinocarboxamide synthase [Acidimicrobiia bacterium]|nr:phosphoribosylaminoimidazolesuccinocarboxamide synthase [Acidimicrobiia bacterium]